MLVRKFELKPLRKNNEGVPQLYSTPKRYHLKPNRLDSQPPFRKGAALGRPVIIEPINGNKDQNP